MAGDGRPQRGKWKIEKTMFSKRLASCFVRLQEPPSLLVCKDVENLGKVVYRDVRLMRGQGIRGVVYCFPHSERFIALPDMDTNVSAEETKFTGKIRHVGEMTLYCASIYYERITTDRISLERATFDRVQASDLTPMQHSDWDHCAEEKKFHNLSFEFQDMEESLLFHFPIYVSQLEGVHYCTPATRKSQGVRRSGVMLMKVDVIRCQKIVHPLKSLNDIIKRSLTSCGIPSLLEPPGISRADGKRPDGLTLIPWSRGKSLIWESTCVDTLAPSHLPNTSRCTASAAELAVKKKVNKYAHLLDNYIFVTFDVETFGPWSRDAKVLVSQIGQILISITGDRRCTTYLRQRLSIAIQRGNAMSVLDTLPESSPLDELFSLKREKKVFIIEHYFWSHRVELQNGPSWRHIEEQYQERFHAASVLCRLGCHNDLS
ncbi:hypothetical protein ANN_05628 [Periplaneta americana]|uniref:Uncharacterized protein n=1 Tax=Periplaneta americana TaxID=6978 RepID=A0ABQ8TCM8_PERAM|nr:hypothetical protein ANN_05628 [Periplaneta americana]